MAGRVGSTRAPRPSSTRSNAGSTVVPPLATRPRISLTVSTASRSASTASSSQTPAGSATTGRASRAARHRRRSRPTPSRTPPAARAASCDSLFGHDDVDQHVQVAARAAPEMRHALAAQPDLGVGLGARLDLDLLVAVDRRDGDLRPERRLGDRDRGLVVELRPVALEARMRASTCTATYRLPGGPPRGPDLALVGQPDLVALVDTRPGWSPGASACARCGRRPCRSRRPSRRSCPRPGSAGRR